MIDCGNALLKERASYTTYLSSAERWSGNKVDFTAIVLHLLYNMKDNTMTEGHTRVADKNGRYFWTFLTNSSSLWSNLFPQSSSITGTKVSRDVVHVLSSFLHCTNGMKSFKEYNTVYIFFKFILPDKIQIADACTHTYPPKNHTLLPCSYKTLARKSNFRIKTFLWYFSTSGIFPLTCFWEILQNAFISR